ncbi:P-type Na+/K+ transporter, partial [Phenoliferia sp. Uapishka_3]
MSNATLVTTEKQPSLDSDNTIPHFFLLTREDLESRLETSGETGITEEEATSRSTRDGLNQLSGGGGGVSILGILGGQLFNAMVLVLIIAFAVCLGIRSWIEGGVIAGVIAANVVVGFYQEYSSAKTVDSLRSLASPTANVIRAGKSITIPSAQVVVGDIVEIKTGDVVPADLRLFEAMNLEIDEALLTGESLPVQKDAKASWGGEAEKSDWDPRDVGVGDRINMAFTSSMVTKGRANGVVVAIGMKTEIGAIATSLGGGETRLRTVSNSRRSTDHCAHVSSPQVKRDDSGHAPIHRYVSAWALTTKDAVGNFLGLTVGTPLQRTLSKLAILLFLIALVFALIVFAANGFQTNDEVIVYAVATALSMIPASLIVVLTITLAGGTRAMANRHVIVRKLDALEALGAVTDICSDKTGTLTQGKMVVRAAWLPSHGTLSIGETSEPNNPTIGQIYHSSLSPVEQNRDPSNKPSETTATDLLAAPSLKTFLDVASLCNLAKVDKSPEGDWVARGDPTECAIQVLAHRFGWGRQSLTEGDRPQWASIAEFPFDSDAKRMSVIFAKAGTEKQNVFTKGAVEQVLRITSDVLTADGTVKLDAAMEAEILANVEALAEQGLRVLCLATKSWSPAGEGEVQRGDVEGGLTMLGLVGLYDPPRPETAGAVRQCQKAGIKIHMLTGDHHATARAIALQVGILPRDTKSLSKEVLDSLVMTAAQFDKMTDEQVDALPSLPLVIARCAPATKVRMVDALHRRKAFCAMTGDGVNDAPSLKRSDIGIAMGLGGSDVAKDASDLVLTDDNFASILNAVEEGRRMFDNIQKFILHLLAQNIIQALVLLVGLAFKDEDGLSVFPLAPVEILWVIMITSGFPAMGIGAQKADSDILTRRPHSMKVGVFTWEVVIDMIVYGVSGAAICLANFALVVYGWGDGNLGRDSNNTVTGSLTVFRARSATFASLTWISLLLAIQVTDLRNSFFLKSSNCPRPYTQWARDLYENPFLLWSCFAGFITIFPIIYIPGLNTVVMKHAPISWEWGLVFISCVLFMAFVEAWKYAKRVYVRRKNAKVGNGDGEGVFDQWGTLPASENATIVV